MADAAQFFNPANGDWEAGHVIDGAQKVSIASSVLDYASLKLTISSSPVLLKVGADVMVGRKQLLVYPPVAGTVYWGKLADVQTGNGVPLKAGDAALSIDIDPINPPPQPYAVSDGSDRQIWVVESK